MNKIITSPVFSGFFLLIIMSFYLNSCKLSKDDTPQKYNLVVLDPGHFHAALVQKSDNDRLDSHVKVFAPEGDEITAYSDLIEQYNRREENPTHWNESLYTGADYMRKMLSEIKGKQNIVVLSGNNEKKADYILESIRAGLNVFADKPMAIDAEGFNKLKEAFAMADKQHVLLYDIMTERYEITNMLQKELMKYPQVFGTLQKGTLDDPAVFSESIHHFSKEVSGKPLIRPAWYFDVKQQGEGIVDVTTHVLDLFIWQCFSGTDLDYTKDVEILNASRWATTISPAEFEKVTNEKEFPDFLIPYEKNGNLEVYANGEINLNLKGVHAKEVAVWNYEAPVGGGDTYRSVIRGAKADLVIQQGKEENFRPVLYIHPAQATDEWESALNTAIEGLGKTFPGVKTEKLGDDSRKVIIPAELVTTHEQHFAKVLDKYLGFLDEGVIPEWEKAAILTKYFITTEALKVAENK